VSFLKSASFLMTRSHRYLPDLPDGPPPEVLGEIEAAWERAQALAEGAELELHFEVDPLGGVLSALRRVDRTLEHRLSARAALAIACGDPMDLHAPALVV